MGIKPHPYSRTAYDKSQGVLNLHDHDSPAWTRGLIARAKAFCGGGKMSAKNGPPLLSIKTEDDDASDLQDSWKKR